MKSANLGRLDDRQVIVDVDLEAARIRRVIMQNYRSFDRRYSRVMSMKVLLTDTVVGNLKRRTIC